MTSLRTRLAETHLDERGSAHSSIPGRISKITRKNLNTSNMQETAKF